ncbi:MAG: phytanoyl-CoA dioxygenase family protein [Gammaproteobacteria bacterium]|nr:phytanoyl-CoA dioxygenase family protein [Gammaproteobacteria bacterium]
MNAALSKQQCERYAQEGIVSPVPALSKAQAAYYCEAIELFERQHAVVAGEVIRNKGHLKCLALYELIHHRAILDPVQSLLGPDLLCWGSSLFIKEPHDPGFVAWHQDAYYWGLEPDDVVTAWIAFAPSTLENGAMQVIPGTHRSANMAHVASATDSANMLFTNEELAEPVDEKKAVDLVLEQGEMSLHHVKLLHGSPPNRSSARRYGFAIRYVAPHVKQRDNRDSATLVRGHDSFGNFKADPVPTRDLEPDIVAFVDAPMGARPR